MALNYRNLDQHIRAHMVAEIVADTASSTLYVSPRLTDEGARDWSALLKEAAQSHSDEWLASELRRRGFIKSHEEKKNPKGGITIAQVPATAPATMSEGEFNRYYVRGVCLRAIDIGATTVVVYRARASENPRPDSEAAIGKAFPAAALLEDLRKSQGIEPALGLPLGPNSGLSVALS